MLVFMVVSLLIGVGVVVGEKLDKKPTDKVPTPISPQSVVKAQVPSPTSSPIPSQVIVESGGIKPFDAYTFSSVTGWLLSKTHTATSDQIILKKDDYQLSILQDALGGGTCIFPGDAPEAMGIALTNPIDIPLQVGLPLRRGVVSSSTLDRATFTICQKANTGAYSNLTEFGVITYITPNNPDPLVMAQMDTMIGSLEKQ